MTGLASVPSRIHDLTNDRAIDDLNDWEIQEFFPAFIPRWNKYMPHVPTDKQWAFLVLDCLEALFGGAVGGGKSDCLLDAALQYVDVPGYAALLLRRTYADLSKPGSLIPRSHDWLASTDAQWRGDLRQWTFPTGAVLDFGYLDNDKDVFKYQSSAYQFIGFDELTQFMEPWYTYLFSRTRRLTTQALVPIRVRGATNPGGVGHEWVKQRFLVEGPEHGRVFISSRLEDNPHLDMDEYERSLAELDPVTQAQLRNGDWNIRPAGDFFNPLWFHYIDEDELPPGLKWLRSWDMAATKSPTSAYTAGVKMARNGSDIYIGHVARQRGDPGETEQLIRSTAERDGRAVEIWIEQEPGSGGVNTIWRYQRTVLFGFVVNPFHPRMDKLSRAKPFSAVTRYGNVFIVRSKQQDNGWMSVFINEAAAFPTGFKDQIDSASQAFYILSTRGAPRMRSL